jgi:hypothetical protein
MDFYLTVFIFIVVFFLYIHIIAQYKKSEDLEIYEMDYVSNTELQTICEMKQPVLFEFNGGILLDDIQKHESYDVKVRDTNDVSDYVVLKYGSFKGLIDSDSKSHFITEGNHEFIEESGLFSEYSDLNPYLKPSLTVQTKYDLLMGSKGAATPLRYHTSDRLFFMVSSGKIRVKMTPWKSRKYLHPIMDYDNYEFRSPIDAFDNTKNHEYMHDVDKLKFLEFDVLPGYVVFVPPYWWYSIQYVESDTLVLGTTYISGMNFIANFPDLVKWYIQQSNVPKNIRTLISEEEMERKEGKEGKEEKEGKEMERKEEKQ